MKLLLIAGLVLIATTVNVSGFRFFGPWWAPRPCPNNTEPAPGWPWFLPGRPCIPVVVGPPPGGNGTNSNNSTDDGGSANNGNAGGNSTDGGNASGNGTAASEGSSSGNSSNTR
uniref:Putative salivary secreted peptide n=1 Tax=Psorophora albipes TaxID=869069 RepID=T1E2N6_9DIPT